MTLRSGSEVSPADINKTSKKPAATRTPGTVPGIFLVAAVVGVLLVLLGIAWTQGWFGQSYVPRTSAGSASTNADTATGSAGSAGASGDHAIGKKRNAEITIYDSGSEERHVK
jgi:hypothetical protein